MTIGYDATGLPQTLNDSIGTVTTNDNYRGQLTTLDVDGPPPAFTFSYDAVGRLTGHTNELGVTESRTYDVAGKLTGVNYTSGGTAVESSAYTLSAAGLRTSLTRPSGTDAFGYDGARQLTRANVGGSSTTLPATPNRQYNYDPVGNRTTSVTDGATTGYTAASTNAYTAVGGVTWTTDVNGNLPSDGSRTFTWEAHDRLMQVQQGGAVTGTYRYDALGRRISQTVGNGSAAKTTRFLYNLWNVVGEFETAAGSPAGAVTLMRRNIWGNDLSGTPQGAGGVGGLLMIEDRSGGTPAAHYVCYDGNGNVVRLLTTGAGGGVITSAVYTYDPFGKVRTAFGNFAATNRWRFSTKLEDAETGLNYYGYRYYDPIAGRWLSRDPIEESGGENLYTMLGNCSTSLIDYLGYYKIEPITLSALRRDSENNIVKDETGKPVLDKAQVMDITVNKCEVLLVDGHGNSIVPHRFKFKSKCAAGGFVGCFPATTNLAMPEERRVTDTDSPACNVLNNSKCFNFNGRMDDMRARALLDARAKAEQICKENCCSKVKTIIFRVGKDLKIDGTIEYELDCAKGQTEWTRSEAYRDGGLQKTYQMDQNGKITNPDGTPNQVTR